MNKIGVIIAAFGIVICLISAGLIIASLESFSSLENSKIYDGEGGEMKIEGYADGGWLIVTMKGKYADGTGMVVDKTANLTKEDCDLVTNFTLTNSEGDNYFTPHCEIDDDTTEDEWIHVGYLCRKGCPDGAYTWDANNTLINVWDGDQVEETLWEGLTRGGAALFSCCCGVVILIIGIFLAFSLQEEDTKQYYQSNNQDTTSSSSGAKGWDERDDYIHKEIDDEEVPEKSEIATPESEDKKDEKQRSGEYKMPPPPQN